RAKEERAAAGRAEAALGPGLGAVPRQPAIGVAQLDLVGVEADEGDERGAMGAATARAVAVRDPARRQRRDEADRAAKAGAGRDGAHGFPSMAWVVAQERPRHPVPERRGRNGPR